VFLFNVLVLVCTLGIPETLSFFLPRLDEHQRGALLGQTLLLLMAAGIVVGFLLWVGAPVFARVQGNPDIAPHVRLFGVYGLFMVLAAFAEPVFIYYQRVRYLFILSTAHGVFFIFITCWRWLGNVSLLEIFTAMMIFSAFKYMTAVMFLYRIRNLTGPLRFSLPGHSVITQLGFALPIALTNTIDTISRWLDKIVVSFFLGTEPLGLFSVGAIEIPFVSVLVSTVYGVVSPKLNELDHKGDLAGFRRMVRNVLSFNAKLIWPFAIYLFVFAGRLMPLLFTHEYDQSVLPFRLYLLLMPLRIFLFGIILVSLGRPRIVLYAAAGSLVVNMVLNVVLVTTIGFAGPAIATVISTILQVAFLFWYVLRRLETGPLGLLPMKKLSAVALACIVSVGASWILTCGFRDDLTAVLISLTIMTGGYIFLGLRLNLFRIIGIDDLFRGGVIEKRRDQHQDS